MIYNVPLKSVPLKLKQCNFIRFLFSFWSEYILSPVFSLIIRVCIFPFSCLFVFNHLLCLFWKLELAIFMFYYANKLSLTIQFFWQPGSHFKFSPQSIRWEEKLWITSKLLYFTMLNTHNECTSRFRFGL